MVRIALLAVIALSSTFAHASLSDEFRLKFSQALEVLADLQVKNLGLVNGEYGDRLMPLARDISERIRYVEVDSIEKPPGATRRSAFAVCETNTVYINRSEFTPGRVPLPIVLHESLGALCVEDVGYQFSTILALLVENRGRGFWNEQNGHSFYSDAMRVLNQADQLKDFYLERLAAQSKIEIANGSAYIGGATYIGNAGDEASSVIRYKLLKRYLQSMGGDDNSSLHMRKVHQAFFNIEIERVQTAKTRVHFIRVLGKSAYDEKFYFYVPETMTVDRAVGDIHDFLKTRLGSGTNFRAEGYVPHARK